MAANKIKRSASKLTVASGGTIEVQSGATLDLKEGAEIKGLPQGAAVADAAGAAPTAAEFKALLDSLRAAGLIATAAQAEG